MKKRILIFLATALVAELVIFNYRTLESLTFQEADYASVEVSEGAEYEDGVVTFTESEAYIDLTGISGEVDNLYLYAKPLLPLSRDLAVDLYAKDEGNADWYRLNESNAIEIAWAKPAQRYIRVHLYGEAESLRICFEGMEGQKLEIYGLQLNQFCPLYFSVARVLAVWLILIALWVFRSGSGLYSLSLFSQKGEKCCGALLITQVVLLTLFIFHDPVYSVSPWSYANQYQELAEAIAEGHFYVLDEPDEALQELENPYDPSARALAGVEYEWDHVYYEGKYYVYYGVVPALLFYLPYYLATGTHLPNLAAVYVCMLWLVMGVMMLLYWTAQRYFKEICAGYFLLLETMLLLGCGVIIICGYPGMYLLPIASGLALSVWGIALWLRSCMDEEAPIRIRYLLPGSVCLALVAGCRPQMLVGSFLALYLLWPGVRRLKDQQRSRAVRTVVAALLPYLLVAIGLMYYNYACFSSPFDFGSAYNLTTNDMTHRGLNMDRALLGVFMSLFQPPVITAKYPFLRAVLWENSYYGTTIHEYLYGGLLWLNPLLCFLPLLRKAADRLKERKLFGPILFSLAMGATVLIFDVEMSAILTRYFCDFGFYFVFPAVLIVMSLLTDASAMRRRAAGFGLRVTALGMTVITGLFALLCLSQTMYL
ncbi:MAG: hypothetical protein LUE92_17865 [Clostridiales bacterium]|nr:hypothetical protein [Clostridiales bacterium]